MIYDLSLVSPRLLPACRVMGTTDAGAAPLNGVSLDSAISKLCNPPLKVTFHQSVTVSRSEARGVHFLSTGKIPAGEPIARVPFESTLSILSIPEVASHWPVAFLDEFSHEPEVLTRFLLCQEYNKAEDSQWWSYIRLLPGQNDLDTPLFWNEDDLSWLQGTNLAATEKRLQSWKLEWERVISKAKEFTADGSLEDCTFDLYKWASTILSSRSFTQNVLRGWTERAEGRSEFAKSQFARRWKDKDPKFLFPVLLPGVDIGNHDPGVRAQWISKDEGMFLSHEEPIAKDTEICNNYGPKGNEELILGYGFMLEDNAVDAVILTTAPSTGSSATTTEPAKYPGPASTKLFAIRSNELQDPAALVQRSLSREDLTTLTTGTFNSREIEAQSVNPTTKDSQISLQSTKRHANITIDRFYLSLENRRDRLSKSAPEGPPQNYRQELAQRHRESQIAILEANMEFLEDHLLSLPSKGRVLTLHKLLTGTEHLSITDPLVSLLTQLCGSNPKAKVIRETGLQDLAYTLCIGGVRLQCESGSLEDNGELKSWIERMARAYKVVSKDRADLVTSYKEALEGYSASNSEVYFADPRWNEDLLAWGLHVWREESVTFESLNRIVRNAGQEEHEHMLFVEPE